MERTPSSAAHRRVGAATVVAIVALLLLGSTRGPAQADTVAATPTVTPAQPTEPADPDPGFRPGDDDGPDRRGDGGPGFGGGGPPDDGGGGFEPAPSTPAPSTPAPSTTDTQ